MTSGIRLVPTLFPMRAELNAHVSTTVNIIVLPFPVSFSQRVLFSSLLAPINNYCLLALRYSPAVSGTRLRRMFQINCRWYSLIGTISICASSCVRLLSNWKILSFRFYFGLGNLLVRWEIRIGQLLVPFLGQTRILGIETQGSSKKKKKRTRNWSINSILMNFLGCPIASIWAEFMEGMKRALRDGNMQGRERKRAWSFGEGLMMGLKVEKLKNSVAAASARSSRMKLWMIRATTSVLLWTCIVQLTSLGDMWAPRVLKGWPSCFTYESALIELPSAPHRVLPPKS